MKIKTMLSWETSTGGNFFQLVNKFQDGSYNTSDIVDMCYLIELDSNPNTNKEDVIGDDDTLESIMEKITAALGEVSGNE